MTNIIDGNSQEKDRRQKSVPVNERGPRAYQRSEKRKGPADRRAHVRPSPHNLPSFLKRLRGPRTLKEAASTIGINDAYLWQLENGKRDLPRPDTLTKIAIGYQIDPAVLLRCAGYFKNKDEFYDDIIEMRSAYLFRDFQKLDEKKKKKLESYLRFLEKEDDPG